MYRNPTSDVLITAIQWNLFSESVLLEKGVVHVFCAEVDFWFTTIESCYREVLSIEEQQLSDRFQLAADRKRSVCGRYLLRHLLAKVLDLKAPDIKFNYSNYRKPAVEGIEFNLSHSGNHVLIAISPDLVGMDVEQINRQFGYESVLDSAFGAEEQEYVERSPDAPLAFYTLWSRKESVMKASGEGLSDHMEQIRSLEESVEWKGSFYGVTSFQIGTDYIASLALDNNTVKTFFWKI